MSEVGIRCCKRRTAVLLTLRWRSNELLHVRRLPAQPLRMVSCRIEVLRGFEKFVIASCGGLFGFPQESGNLFLSHWLECSCCFKGLVEDLRAIDSSDDDRGRQVHGVVQAID